MKNLLPILILLSLLVSSCCGTKALASYPDQDIPELAPLEPGASFSFLDSEGKRTTISKIDSFAYSIKAEASPVPERKGSFINVEIHKDKSKVITNSNNKDKSTNAGSGAIIGKDQSENKGAENSGNKSTQNSFPWYVWVILVGGVVGFLFWKFR